MAYKIGGQTAEFCHSMKNDISHLSELVYEGARTKNLAMTDDVIERIVFELEIIETEKFVGYFLLFARIIEACNELKLLRSHGRGSAMNSMVCYCLDITKINPITENLISERILFKNQIYCPDIDLDIPKDHRQNILKKLKENHPEYQIYNIALDTSSERYYREVVLNGRIYKLHPSGLAITAEALPNQIIICDGENYCIVDDPKMDKVFWEKVDFAEIEYLNRLQHIVDLIGDEFYPNKIPLDDPDVFNCFSKGDIENLFQLNDSNLKPFWEEFLPNSIRDLSIINALYRKGSEKFIPEIIQNKLAGEELFKMINPLLDSILEETYGVLIYHEQFMHIQHKMAGFTYTEAELWRRRIMHDKNNVAIELFKTAFAQGCREQGTADELDVLLITNMIEKMLPYIFLKSHSFSYAIIGYWGAYYKTYFREQFDEVFKNKIGFQPFELHTN